MIVDAYLEGWEEAMVLAAPCLLLLPPSTLPGLLSSSSAMLASLPAAPKANLQDQKSSAARPGTFATGPDAFAAALLQEPAHLLQLQARLLQLQEVSARGTAGRYHTADIVLMQRSQYI